MVSSSGDSDEPRAASPLQPSVPAPKESVLDPSLVDEDMIQAASVLVSLSSLPTANTICVVPDGLLGVPPVLISDMAIKLEDLNDMLKRLEDDLSSLHEESTPAGKTWFFHGVNLESVSAIRPDGGNAQYWAEQRLLELCLNLAYSKHQHSTLNASLLIEKRRRAEVGARISRLEAKLPKHLVGSVATLKVLRRS